MPNFNPDNYPGEYPEEWYDEYPGQIVGSVSLLRDLLSWSSEGDPQDYIIPPEQYVPRIFFSIGSWVDGEWMDGVSGGCGVLLGLNEDGDVPTVTLGDPVIRGIAR